MERVIDGGAWRRLMKDLGDAQDRSGEALTDFEIAEVVRELVWEVEGDEL